MSSCLFESRINLKKNFSGYHTTGKNASVTAAIKYKDEIWIKAVAVAIILKYKNTMKSIGDHVDPEDKRKLSELRSKSKQNKTDPLKSKQNESFWLKTTSESRESKTEPLKRNEGNTIYINVSGTKY